MKNKDGARWGLFGLLIGVMVIVTTVVIVVSSNRGQSVSVWEKVVSKMKYTKVSDKVDYFVDQLTTTYEHYDAFGKHAETVYSEGKSFRISPMGRLIVVKVDEYVSDDYYEDVFKTLKAKFDGDSRVRDVFINDGGTITIDCRN